MGIASKSEMLPVNWERLLSAPFWNVDAIMALAFAAADVTSVPFVHEDQADPECVLTETLIPVPDV